MGTVPKTTYYTNDLLVGDADNRSETLLAAGAITLLKGTILGRINASGKVREWVAGSSDGSQVAIGVLSHDVVAAAGGDFACRMIARGTVRTSKLIAYGATVTLAAKESLRDYGIFTLDATETRTTE